MKKTLIIVDPQYDFIEGGKLAVEGGTAALNKVVEYILSGEVGMVITTQDWHCPDHCSFVHYGGEFPEHCVADTHGAEIYAPIVQAITTMNIFWLNYKKGQRKEAFTAFNGNPTRYLDHLAYNINDLSGEDQCIFSKSEEVQICGLAGDICVMNTAAALKEMHPVILDNLTASLDDNNFRFLATELDIPIIEAVW